MLSFEQKALRHYKNSLTDVKKVTKMDGFRVNLQFNDRTGQNILETVSISALKIFDSKNKTFKNQTIF